VTSPPYFGLRDYGIPEQVGLEATPEAYVAELVAIFREVHRVLRDDGTLWLNLGDSYAGSGRGGDSGSSTMHSPQPNHSRAPEIVSDAQRQNCPTVLGDRMRGLKPKDLVGIPWRVAFALQADGWYLRQDIIWSKPNPMPESVQDRCTKAHEYLFLLSKSERYRFDAEAIAEKATGRDPGNEAHKHVERVEREVDEGNHRERTKLGLMAIGAKETRNKRSVWTVASQPFKEAHFATFPPALIEPCILAGCPVGGVVLDPFGGAGTTGLVADRLQRDAVLIELNPAYADMARKRIAGESPLFAEVA
jgi:DNA modification methylase